MDRKRPSIDVNKALSAGVRFYLLLWTQEHEGAGSLSKAQAVWEQASVMNWNWGLFTQVLILCAH